MQIKDIQAVELRILRKFIAICNRHHLNYFLVGGSLLGAVRHHGFIPWDDDIDVGMLRADYERFIRLAQTELCDTPYFVQTPYSDQNYAFAFSKILDRRYDVQERFNHNDAQNGIFIDIFPFDVIPEDSWHRSVQVAKMKYATAQLLLKLKYRPFEFGEHKYAPLSPKKQAAVLQLKQNRDLVMQRYNARGLQSGVVCKNLSSQYPYAKELILYRDLLDVVPSTFADTTVMIPRTYDRILTNLYGDYMTPPPTEQRISKHLTTVDYHSVDQLHHSQAGAIDANSVKATSLND